MKSISAINQFLIASTMLLSCSLSAGSQPLPDLITTIRCDTIQTLFGTRIVPLGDQNNDTFDDFITWDFRFRAFLYFGGTTVDTLPGLIFDSVNNRFNNIDDVNNDGFDDFILKGRSPYNHKLGLFHGGPTLDTARDAWFGIDTLLPVGFTINSKDINSNGSAEIISSSQDFSSILLYELGINQDTVQDQIIRPFGASGDFVFGQNLMSGDFDGDGALDLAVSLRFPAPQEKNGSIHFFWGGSAFDTIPNVIISRPGPWFEGTENFGDVLESLGDFNGDGFDDFLAGSASSSFDTSHFVYFGGPNIDTIPDIEIERRLTCARLAGDINSDGYNDLIVSYPLPFSGAGDVRIFYGGPNVDSVPDIVIHNSDMPELQREFGMDCSGVGDMNGDGIDDFAFSAVEGSTGVVYVFSGNDISTGIEIEFDPILPTVYLLSQNFPNPFNPETTIKFALPKKTSASLTIHNILGAEILTLVNKTLSAGEYTVTWDGRGASGELLSSGVYFYRLSTDEFIQNKKMLLIK